MTDYVKSGFYSFSGKYRVLLLSLSRRVISASDLTGSDALYDHRYKYVRTRHVRRWLSLYYPFSLLLRSSSLRPSQFPRDFGDFSVTQLRRKYNIKKRTIVIVKSAVERSRGLSLVPFYRRPSTRPCERELVQIFHVSDC